MNTTTTAQTRAESGEKEGQDMETKFDRTLNVLVVGIVLAALLYLGVHLAGAGTRAPLTRESVVTCQEDEPCWDCRTMGNGLCGESTDKYRDCMVDWTADKRGVTVSEASTECLES